MLQWHIFNYWFLRRFLPLKGSLKLFTSYLLKVTEIFSSPRNWPFWFSIERENISYLHFQGICQHLRICNKIYLRWCLLRIGQQQTKARQKYQPFHWKTLSHLQNKEYQRATINPGAGCRKWADSTLQQITLPILVIY